MAKVLIIEDELDLAELLAINLENDGYEPTIALTGEKGIAEFIEGVHDLVLLDLMMPGLNGIEVCRQIRRLPRGEQVPIIMVTARSSEEDRVNGLESGADDYVVKPFSVRELLLRIRTKLPRTLAEQATQTRFQVGALVVDLDRHLITAGNREINLTQTEYKLLTSLVRAAGKVLTRDALLSDVWGDCSEIDHRTIDSYVTRLRMKMGDLGDMVQTIRGFGYKLEPLNQ